MLIDSLELNYSFNFRPVAIRDQKKFASCLSEFVNSEKGQQCISPISAVDPISSEASLLICAA